MLATIRRLTAVLTLAVVCGPSWAAPVPEIANSGLAFVPAQAPIVVHLRGVERTKERLTGVLNKAVPDFGPLGAGLLDTMFQTALEGRKLTGLVKDGQVFLAFLEMPAANVDIPAVALVVRVTRYSDFRDGILFEEERKNLKPDAAGFESTSMNGKPVYFLDRKEFAVLTPSKDVATLIAKKPESLANRLDTEVGRGLLASDVSVYVNLAAVNREYGDQIKAFRQLMQSVVDTMPAGGAAQKASVDMVKNAYDSVFQVVEDGRAAVLGLDFRPEGLNLHLQAQVGVDTKTNKYLKEEKPAALADLGTLPSGKTFYTASQFSPALFQTVAPLIYGTVGEGDVKKMIEAALEQLAASGRMASYSASNVPPSGIQVDMFRDPAKATAAQLQLFRAMGEGATFQSAYIKGKPEIKENAQEYKGFKLHSAFITWDIDKFADAIPGGGEAMKSAMKKLLGEGIKVWFGTDGRRYVAVNAKDWADAQAQLDVYLSGRNTLAAEDVFKLTRQQLPADASLFFLADAGKYAGTMIDYMLSMLKAMPGLPIALPNELKPVKTDVSYIGVAIAVKSEHGSFDLFLPVGAVAEIRKVVMPLFQGGVE
jgi:hypothetical protein